MIKVNVEQLVEVSVSGDVSHPEMADFPNLSVGQDGRPYLPIGTGGIRYNVKVGDSAFEWAWGDHVEPGVSIRNSDARANTGLTALSCIGNEALLVRCALESKDAKLVASTGVVVGKHAGSVLVHFPKRVLERLCVGDRVQVKASGVGLKLRDYPAVSVMNCGPNLMRAVNPSEKGGRVRVMVAKLIPGSILGSGLGSSNGFTGDLDIQGVSPEIVKEYSLDLLRLGDLVAISDLDCTYGARWHRDAVTIGLVVHGSSGRAGHGPGVNVLMTSTQATIEPIITRKANIGELLKLP